MNTKHIPTVGDVSQGKVIAKVFAEYKVLQQCNDDLVAALHKLTESAAKVCSATDGIAVINAVAELRPLMPEMRGLLYDLARAALAKVQD